VSLPGEHVAETTKVIILAGGRGTRLSELSSLRPKPMVEIGGKPILWHIMSIYAAHGYRDFIVACGYLGWMIKEYFLNFFSHHSDLQIDLRDGNTRVLGTETRDWRVTVVDTGQDTTTAGRLLRLQPLLDGHGCLVTYGDGVGSVDIAKLAKFHREHGRLATVTAVRPPARFGALNLEGDRVKVFEEKPQSGEGWINGGFFVLEPGAFAYLRPEVTLESEPLERLAVDGQLMAFRHYGHWQAMDTLRDTQTLEAAWQGGNAPWKVW
jgi:glucose-1-phosphate cytidylyltransferase